MSVKMIYKFSIFFLMVVLSACSPINYDDAPDYNAYFPLHESDSSEYLVHEIQHTSLGTDTLRYFLKEVVKFGYIDGEGDLAYQFHRYWKQDSLTEYSLKDVWSIKKKSKSAEKVEENIRYVKMIFPLYEQSYWDGNLFNSLGYKEYTINQIHVPYTLNSAYFDSVVEVAHFYNSNLLEYESEKEIYALNKGLIYKENIHLNINGGNILDINYGSQYIQELIE